MPGELRALTTSTELRGILSDTHGGSDTLLSNDHIKKDSFPCYSKKFHVGVKYNYNVG